MKINDQLIKNLRDAYNDWTYRLISDDDEGVSKEDANLELALLELFEAADKGWFMVRNPETNSFVDIREE